MAHSFENFILSQINDNNNGKLIVLGARPAMGKSTFLATTAKILAIDNGLPTAIFSLEMSIEHLVRRILSITSNIPCYRLHSGDLNNEEEKKVRSCMDDMASKPLYINDTANMDISEIKKGLKKLVKDKDIRYILIDYLQLISASDEKLRERQLEYICRGLKKTAEEFHITIIAASQCGRHSTSQNNMIPTLYDLFSYSIAKGIIDNVWLLYRPSYYKIFENRHDNGTKNIAGLHLYKGDTKVSEEKFIFDESIPEFGSS